MNIKETKEEAKYDIIPNPNKRCADCFYFEPVQGSIRMDGACALVAGIIRRDASCDLYLRKKDGVRTRS